MAREFRNTTTDKVAPPTTPTPPAAATYVVLVKLGTGTVQSQTLFFYGGGTGFLAFAIITVAPLRVSFEQSRVTQLCNFRSDGTSEVLDTNTWYAIAATYDESASPAAHIYLASFDGTDWSDFAEMTYATSQSGSGATTGTSGSWGIGNNNNNNGAKGQQIALAVRWDSVKSLSELNAWLANGFQIAGQGVLAYWFKDANTLARDFSGNQRNGTITGTVVQSDPAGLAPTELTSAVANKVYDGTTSATITGVSLPGFTVSLTGATATFADKNVGTNKTVTISGGSLSGADAGLFSIGSSAIASITKRPLTVTLAANDKVFDGTTAASGTLSLT